jgi:phosphohistidine phosphatase
MKIFLMRHGVAHDLGRDGSRTDAERTLTDKGRSGVRACARAMRVMELEFDAILTSPLPRAAETARIVAAELGCPHCLFVCEELAPGAPTESGFSLLTRHGRAAAVLLVGHEPDLSRLVARLVWGGLDGGRLEMKKSGLCCIERDQERRIGGGTLRWALTPKQLRLIAGERE